MTYFKVKESIKVPQFTTEQRIIKLKCEAGVLLNESDYSILVEDANSYVGSTEEFSESNKKYRYLKNKYNVDFNISALNKALSKL